VAIATLPVNTMYLQYGAQRADNCQEIVLQGIFKKKLTNAFGIFIVI
jgi:hypothetical protein